MKQPYISDIEYVMACVECGINRTWPNYLCEECGESNA